MHCPPCIVANCEILCRKCDIDSSKHRCNKHHVPAYCQENFYHEDHSVNVCNPRHIIIWAIGFLTVAAIWYVYDAKILSDYTGFVLNRRCGNEFTEGAG